MGAALWPNAHRQRAALEILAEGPCTLGDLADLLGISEDDAGHVLRRLRRPGLEVEVLDDFQPAPPLYRLRFAVGRICAEPGCGTVLRTTNPSDRCDLHGSGMIDLAGWRRKASPARIADHAREVAPGQFAAELRAERERRRLGLRELARLTGVDASHLSRIEHGTRHPSAEVAELITSALHSVPIAEDVPWRALREGMHLSLREVSRRAGINAAVLSRVERGERRATRYVEQRLAQVLGSTVLRR